MLATRIGVLSAGDTDLPDRTREASGEPVPLSLPSGRPMGGVALVREWVADVAQISCSSERLDAVLLAAEKPEELAGLVLAALRLNLPAVVDPPGDARLFAALAALGLAPVASDPVEVAVGIASGPRPLELVESFSLANALRAAYSLGEGPEALVHFSAIAREARAVGFEQMFRVLLPETPVLAQPDSAWFEQYGVAGILAHLGETLNDTRTVEGDLRQTLPAAPPPPADGSRLIFVVGRASGTEALCRVKGADEEISGECRVHHSEMFAARVVEGGFVEADSLLVVGGCGPRGGPGLVRLDRLSRALRESGLEESITVMTDGLPPRDARGRWVSLVSPEATAGGVIGRLRSGDFLRIDLLEGRIRTGVKAGELENRDPYELPDHGTAGYAARYARSALSAFEGAGFG